MFRCLIAIGFASVTALSGFACERRPEWRPADTAGYAAAVDECLANKVDGLRFDEALEAENLTRVNAARRSAGLPPLQIRRELLTAARLHSFDMAQDRFFDHEGPDRRKAADRVAALDRTLIHSELRENIATVRGDLKWDEAGQILHNILMDSPGHRENILAPDITHIAIGVARYEKGAWLTQVFVRQEGAFRHDVPTSASREDLARLTSDLRDWMPDGLLLAIDDVEYPVSADVLLPTGEAALRVIGTRQADANRRFIIHLPGPSVTVAPQD
ncbi:MAG: CAP domain-containing protein [Pseudomonadota bacterium]